MKKFSLLFALVITLFISSCSSDDNGNQDNTQLIVGKWEFFQVSETTDGSEQLEAYEHYANCGKDNIEFFGNGTFEDNYFEFSSSQCHSYSETGTWSINGNTMTTSYGNGDSTLQIITLDQSVLKVKSTYVSGNVTYTNVSVFKRL